MLLVEEHRRCIKTGRRSVLIPSDIFFLIVLLFLLLKESHRSLLGVQTQLLVPERRAKEEDNDDPSLCIIKVLVVTSSGVREEGLLYNFLSVKVTYNWKETQPKFPRNRLLCGSSRNFRWNLAIGYVRFDQILASVDGVAVR
jgi:nitrate reductase gamma subunit